MDTNTKWKYILLGVGAFLVAIVIIYLRVAAYFHIPVISLLPPLPFATTTPSSTTRPTSVVKTTLDKGGFYFDIHGKFPAKPYYLKDTLRGEFVIDEDPYGSRIPVIMTAKTGKINVGRAQGSLAGTTVWRLEDTEALRLAVKPGGPASLRIQFFTPVLSEYETMINAALENITRGNWNIPKDFVFVPVSVAVVE